jgi:hypothetical protein
MVTKVAPTANIGREERAGAATDLRGREDPSAGAERRALGAAAGGTSGMTSETDASGVEELGVRVDGKRRDQGQRIDDIRTTRVLDVPFADVPGSPNERQVTGVGNASRSDDDLEGPRIVLVGEASQRRPRLDAGLEVTGRRAVAGSYVFEEKARRAWRLRASDLVQKRAKSHDERENLPSARPSHPPGVTMRSEATGAWLLPRTFR